MVPLAPVMATMSRRGGWWRVDIDAVPQTVPLPLATKRNHEATKETRRDLRGFFFVSLRGSFGLLPADAQPGRPRRARVGAAVVCTIAHICELHAALQPTALSIVDNNL